MNTVIETKELQKTYHTNGVATEAVRNLSFQITQGEFAAIMGPSGCGKSTLLHLLGGLERPTAGEIVIAGQRMDSLNESGRAVLRRQTVGFVFQTLNLIPSLTAAENIDLPGLLIGRPRGEVATRRNQLLEVLGIANKTCSFPSVLSGGQQQRVAIARALINRPAALLADEPTGSLDSRSAAEVLSLLRDFHAQGQTILLVTHDAKVSCSAERVIFMRDGQFIDEMQLDKSYEMGPVLSRLVKLEM